MSALVAAIVQPHLAAILVADAVALAASLIAMGRNATR